MTAQRIYVAGHGGLAGRAIAAHLRELGHTVLTRTRAELDLLDARAVAAWLRAERPDAVVLAAAKVGGIVANRDFPATFLYENLAIAQHVIEGAYRAGIGRLLFLGSSCIYPKFAPQPIVEESLLTSPLEPTNEAYALAKIAGLKLCAAYRAQYGVLFHSLMPCNLYGPGDNYHPEHSHVLPALLRRFHEAKETGAATVTLWGTGSPRREFLHTADLARAVATVLFHPNPPDWINAGAGSDVTILELAETIATATGFSGELRWDTTRPDGTPRKLLDNGKIAALGWAPQLSLREGIARTYADFLAERAAGVLRA